MESISQDKRAIVRRRTQQLVYLELGRDNGGVMLNLSEDGCGFQAITPVKPGQTRFAFQISGGRRISGEADVVWVDDVGIMGGLRFLSLPLEARKQIRRWLEETKAPEEHGAFEPVAEAPMASAGSSREQVVTDTTEPPWTKGYQQSHPNQPSARMVEVEMPPASTAWSTLRASSASVGHDPRYASIPPLRDEESYIASRPRSVALWRGIAVLAVVTAIFALVVAYQRDVGSSLIWLGETLSGRTKASSSLSESKAASNAAQDRSSDSSSASASPDSDAASSKVTENGAQPAASTPKKAVETPASVAGTSESSRLDSGATGSDRTVSMLERQVPQDKPVEAWSSSDSISSLWDAVQGGSISAERALAERFVLGQGVNRNCDQAKVLLKAAADRGSREARLRLYELETGGCR